MGSHASDNSLITLDGSHGEGGGQILRTALSLSLLTGRPFRMIKIRANREKPGLRPQHLAAVEAAAQLGHAETTGAEAGSRSLTFRPQPYDALDLDLEIGTAGATALVLHTLHLPLALKATAPVHLRLGGGTFNLKAPSFPFLDQTWKRWCVLLGAGVDVSMPRAGFYPRGGGTLEATLSPAGLRPLELGKRGPLCGLRIEAGVARLPRTVAERMRDRALERLATHGLAVEPECVLTDWDTASPGAAIAMAATHEACPVPATFVGLGERGKPAERVADEAVDELLAYLKGPPGAVDPHSADQLLLPLSLAKGPSVYTVGEVTEHLRTNIRTIQAFVDRTIVLDEHESDDAPTRVRID